MGKLRGQQKLGYGVIGSPADSGSVSLGSSPGTPALQIQLHKLKNESCRRSFLKQRFQKPKAIEINNSRAPSSSGLGLWLLKPATRVRIPSGLLLSYG